MAKKSTTKKKPAVKKARAPVCEVFFDVHFYLEGGTSMWMRVKGTTRAELERKFVELLDAEGCWLRLNAHSGVVHLRRNKVLGFLVDDVCVEEDDELEADENHGLLIHDVSLRDEDRDIELNEK